MTPEVHDFLVGVRGAHRKAMTGLRDLLKVGLKAPNLGIDVVIVKKNLHELADLLRLCRRLEMVHFLKGFGVRAQARSLAKKKTL